MVMWLGCCIPSTAGNAGVDGGPRRGVRVSRPFRQVDVFTSAPLLGNPVAVVHDADGTDDETMQRFARWTNLSETTFLLAPTVEGADYRVRIFTPGEELPFAGHPTLGTCHAWLEAGGEPRDPGVVVQECPAGLVRVRRTPEGLAFAAPPLVRSGPVDDALRRHLADVLRIDPDAVVDAAWVDNGPGWVGVLLRSAEEVLALRPSGVDLDVGVVGPYPEGSPVAFELRGFFQVGDAAVEDPVTGSLNASVAQWLLGSGRASAPYVASQGTAIGRAGRVLVSQDADGTVWVGGATTSVLVGTVDLATT
jgi:PhzF family phenazine biosynthesis protein